MSQYFSEINKIVNVISPKTATSGQAAAFGTASTESDIVNMKLYNRCAFIMSMGPVVAETHWNVKVMACPSSTGIGIVTPMAFHYRTQGAASTGEWASGSDTPSTMTAGTTDGVDTTTGYLSGILVIEVNASEVAAAGSSGDAFDHVKLYVTSTTGADAPRGMGVIAILSEPRYPQAVLDTAID
jgi:hypothetical protein